jgi:hypothetical protein
VPDFSFHFCKTYVLVKFIEVATFHPIDAKKISTNMFKGAKKIA